MRTCTACGIEKPLSEYYCEHTAKGYKCRRKCKDCYTLQQYGKARNGHVGEYKKPDKPLPTLVGNDLQTRLRRRAWRLNFVRVRRELREGAA